MLQGGRVTGTGGLCYSLEVQSVARTFDGEEIIVNLRRGGPAQLDILFATLGNERYQFDRQALLPPVVFRQRIDGSCSIERAG